MDLEIICDDNESSSFSPSSGLKTRRRVKDAQECSLFCPVDISRMMGNLGLVRSSKLPSQCWFNQSQMIGMGMPNCMGRSFFHDDEDDEEVEQDLVVGDEASFMGSQTIKARLP